MEVPVSLNEYGLDTRNSERHVNVENIHIEQEIKTSILDLRCKASEAGSDDASFPTHFQLFCHLARHPGMKLKKKKHQANSKNLSIIVTHLYRDGDIAI